MKPVCPQTHNRATGAVISHPEARKLSLTPLIPQGSIAMFSFQVCALPVAASPLWRPVSAGVPPESFPGL